MNVASVMQIQLMIVCKIVRESGEAVLLLIIVVNVVEII